MWQEPGRQEASCWQRLPKLRDNWKLHHTAGCSSLGKVTPTPWHVTHGSGMRCLSKMKVEMTRKEVKEERYKPSFSSSSFSSFSFPFLFRFWQPASLFAMSTSQDPPSSSSSSSPSGGRSTLELFQCSKMMSDRVADTVRLIQTVSTIGRLPRLVAMHDNKPPRLFYLAHELSTLTDVAGSTDQKEKCFHFGRKTFWIWRKDLKGKDFNGCQTMNAVGRWWQVFDRTTQIWTNCLWKKRILFDNWNEPKLNQDWLEGFLTAINLMDNWHVLSFW